MTLIHIHRNVALNQWNHISIYFPLTQGSSLKSTQVSKYICFLSTFIWFQDTDMPRKSNKRGALVPTSPTLHGLKNREVALRHQNPLRTWQAHRVGTLPGVSAPVSGCISNRLPGDAVAAAWRTDAIKKCELNKWSETWKPRARQCLGKDSKSPEPTCSVSMNKLTFRNRPWETHYRFLWITEQMISSRDLLFKV